MKTTRYMLFCLIVIFIAPSIALCESRSAENHVKEFYRWYIRSGTKISIHSDLSEYVDACMLSTLRTMYERNYFETGYFTKSQDYWDEWLDVLIVHKEMKINDTTSVVPITFKLSEDKQHHLLVFVRKQIEGWRIIKVTGTDDFYE